MLSIQTVNISKIYHGIQAISDINLSIDEGELFGLIGPDGAGKTSIFRILTTLLIPDKGKATIEGYDVVRDFKMIRQISGYMPGRFSLYQDLSVEENLKFYASIFNTTIEENYHLVKEIYQQIEPFRTRLAGNLSGGMKQKLALSCALIHSPKVLFLDEPTTGVDAVSRKEFWEMLKNLQKKGITILVSTPYMDEAELCDRVGLIQKGTLMDVDTPGKIIQSFGHDLFAVKTRDMYSLINDLRKYENTRTAFRFGDVIHFTPITDHNVIELTEKFLESKGHKDIEMQKIRPDIEDCFMARMVES